MECPGGDLPTKYPPLATILLLADTSKKKELLGLSSKSTLFLAKDLDDRWGYFFREVQCKLVSGFVWVYMDVSENSGFSPQIIHFKKVFHDKPSILVVFPLFLETPMNRGSTWGTCKSTS